MMLENIEVMIELEPLKISELPHVLNALNAEYAMNASNAEYAVNMKSRNL